MVPPQDPSGVTVKAQLTALLVGGGLLVGRALVVGATLLTETALLVGSALLLVVATFVDKEVLGARDDVLTTALVLALIEVALKI